MKTYKYLKHLTVAGRGLIMVVDIPPTELLPDKGEVVSIDGKHYRVADYEVRKGDSVVGLQVTQLNKTDAVLAELNLTAAQVEALHTQLKEYFQTDHYKGQPMQVSVNTKVAIGDFFLTRAEALRFAHWLIDMLEVPDHA